MFAIQHRAEFSTKLGRIELILDRIELLLLFSNKPMFTQVFLKETTGAKRWNNIYHVFLVDPSIALDKDLIESNVSGMN